MVYSKSRRRHRPPRQTAYEPFETATISQLLKEGDVFIDIGAHTGHYTILASQIVGRHGYIYAFEPDPTNFRRLRERVEKASLYNVSLVQKAVSNKTGKLRLYLNPRNPGDHRLYDSNDGRHFIEVEATSLDDYFSPSPPKVDFIKLDIQGSEPAAIEGMSALIRKNPVITIATEFWPFGLKTFGVDPGDYLKKLWEYGFKLANINELSKKLEPITSINDLLTYYTPQNNCYTNLLAYKGNLLIPRDTT